MSNWFVCITYSEGYGFYQALVHSSRVPWNACEFSPVLSERTSTEDLSSKTRFFWGGGHKEYNKCVSNSFY